MCNVRMSWLLIIFVCFIFCHSSYAKHGAYQKKISFVVVVGTVYCEACSQRDFSSSTSHFISGAVVAVGCRGSKLKAAFYKEVKTDKHGAFKVHLPFTVVKHIKTIINQCSVKLISSSNSFCSVVSSSSSSSLNLKSKKEDGYVLSTGVFIFKPEVCNQKKVGNPRNAYEGNPFVPGDPPYSP